MGPSHPGGRLSRRSTHCAVPVGNRQSGGRLSRRSTHCAVAVGNRRSGGPVVAPVDSLCRAGRQPPVGGVSCRAGRLIVPRRSATAGRGASCRAGRLIVPCRRQPPVRGQVVAPLDSLCRAGRQPERPMRWRRLGGLPAQEVAHLVKDVGVGHQGLVGFGEAAGDEPWGQPGQGQVGDSHARVAAAPAVP